MLNERQGVNDRFLCYDAGTIGYLDCPTRELILTLREENSEIIPLTKQGHDLQTQDSIQTLD
jgi:hypothetical protein